MGDGVFSKQVFLPSQQPELRFTIFSCHKARIANNADHFHFNSDQLPTHQMSVQTLVTQFKCLENGLITMRSGEAFFAITGKNMQIGITA